jgi:hypothetical protein
VLLNAGADVNAQGRYSSNAFYAAAYRGYLQVLKLLMLKKLAILVLDFLA